MPVYFAKEAYLGRTWATRVRLEVDDHGLIRGLEEHSSPAGAIELVGPLLPLLPNVHSHAIQRAMAGLAEQRVHPDDDFWSWRETMYAFSLAVEPDDLRAIAAWLYVEMLERGYGSVCEFHYLHHRHDGSPYAAPAAMSQAILDAADEAGLPITLLPVLYQRAGFDDTALHPAQRRFVHEPGAFLELHDALRPACEGREDRRLGIALHSLRAVESAAIEACLARLSSTAPLHIHIAEQQREVDECLRTLGRRPVQWLAEKVALDARWCLVHATHLEADEIDAIAGSGATVALCPSTEANLGDGVFPLESFRRAGGRIAIGSDSHISVSPREELRWLEYGQRLLSRRRNVGVVGDERHVGSSLYAAALDGGAQASALAVGRLAPGLRADWMLLDPDHPSLAGASGDEWIDRWIFAGDDACVRDVYLGGDRVVENGRHRDRDRLLARFREHLLRLHGDLDSLGAEP